MKSFSFTILALALLQIAKCLPCIGDSCGRLPQLYSVFDDENGVFYIREGSHNSASSINDDNNEQPEKEGTYQLQEPQHSNMQRLSQIYQQSVRPNTSGQTSYQSNQQLYNPSTPYDGNQETQHGFKPGRNNQGNKATKSRNQGGSVGDFQNNDDVSSGQHPSRGNQGADGDHYQNNGDEYYGHYPGSKNQGGGGGDYYQMNGGYYGHYPDRDSSCPNCYATNFGNGDFNHNIINIEK